MEQKQYSLVIYVLLVGLTISAVFGCVYYAQSVFMMESGHSAGADGCCDMNLLFSNVTHNIPLILGNSSLQFLLPVLLMVMYLFVKGYYTKVGYALNNYFKIQDRYGGFNLFNDLILSFSKGIIHPKIY